MKIHPTAIIDPTARVGEDVEVGAYTVIGPDCAVGDGTVIGPHVVLEELTTLGKNCHVRAGVVLGGPPQDRKFKGERSYVQIGDNNLVREYVTIHRATGEGQATRIGDDNQIMAYVHVGHNCDIGSHTTIASYVALAGHVTVEDAVVFGGMVGVHQFVRVGKIAMIGGYSKVVQDVPPFMLADGRPADVLDLNVRGLRRSGMGPAIRASLRHAYKLLYRSNLNVSQALEIINDEIESNPELDCLVEFIKRINGGSSGRQDDRPHR